MSTVTMTATPEPITGSVLLNITATGLPSGYNGDLFTLTRTDANGSAAVRRLTGQSITSGSLILRDYEAALAGPISYTAQAGTTTTTVRTNRVIDPRATALVAASALTASQIRVTNTNWFGPGGGAGTYSLQAWQTPAPQNTAWFYTYIRKAWTTAGGPLSAGFVLTNTTVTSMPQVVAGDKLYMSAYVRSNVPAGHKAAAFVSWRNEANTVISEQYGPSVSPGSDPYWNRVEGEFVAPAGATRMFLMIDTAGSTANWDAGTNLDVCALTVELNNPAGSDRTYFDGSMTNDVGVTYAWTGTVNASTNTKTTVTADAAVTASTALNTGQDVVSVAVLPQYRAEPQLTTAFQVSRTSLSTVHQVIGRPDPLVAIGALGYRTGNIGYFSTSLEDAEAIASVYDRGEVVLLRFSDQSARDVYHVANSLSIEPVIGTGNWELSVDFTELARPSGPLLGALGWTFENVAALTFTQVKTQYATFGALQIGPV